MKDALSNVNCLTQYPDLDETLLRQALAKYAGVNAKEVLVANGFVPLLDAALRALGVRSCVLPVPAFNEYRKVLEQNNVAITPVVLHPELGFRYAFEDLLGTECEAVLLANPQNPSGILANRDALLDFAAQAARRGKHVLLDEAFIEYAPGESLAPCVEANPNLVVFRSLTKFFGMPGLRVAYAVANEDVSTKIGRFLPPWPITTLASIATVAALEDRAYIQTSLASNDARRAFLNAGLERLGFEVFQGAANFLLFKAPEAELLWRRLIVERGIVLRLCTDYDALPGGFFRVAVREEQATLRLLASLELSR